MIDLNLQSIQTLRVNLLNGWHVGFIKADKSCLLYKAKYVNINKKTKVGERISRECRPVIYSRQMVEAKI